MQVERQPNTGANQEFLLERREIASWGSNQSGCKRKRGTSELRKNARRITAEKPAFDHVVGSMDIDKRGTVRKSKLPAVKLPAVKLPAVFWSAAVCVMILGCREAVPGWQCAWSRREPLQMQLSVAEHRWRVTKTALGDETLTDIAVGEQTSDGLLLYVPVDTPLVLALQSEDYIYSLGIPDLGLKEMAVPGLAFRLHLRPMKVGQYALQGGELCGDPGVPAPGRLVVESREEFERRLRENRS